jgi:CRISPR-associated protein Cas1
VLTIETHGAILKKNYGNLIAILGPQTQSVPIEDIRALIVTAKGVTFTTDLLNALTSSGAIVLICNNYKPSSVASSLECTIKKEAILNLSSMTNLKKIKFWRRIIKEKIINQRFVLEKLTGDQKISVLSKYINSETPDIYEASASKYYFSKIMPLISDTKFRRMPRSKDPINSMLNYGYSIITTLVQRSILLNGLSPNVGFKHTTRYHTLPLAYDIVEPFRPIVDLELNNFFSNYIHKEDNLFENWRRHFPKFIINNRILFNNNKIKLMDCLDFHVRTMRLSIERVNEKLIKYPSFITRVKNEKIE